MHKAKIWSKPTVTISQVRLAKAGQFNATDAAKTHRS